MAAAQQVQRLRLRSDCISMHATHVGHHVVYVGGAVCRLSFGSLPACDAMGFVRSMCCICIYYGPLWDLVSCRKSIVRLHRYACDCLDFESFVPVAFKSVFLPRRKFVKGPMPD